MFVPRNTSLNTVYLPSAKICMDLPQVIETSWAFHQHGGKLHQPRNNRKDKTTRLLGSGSLLKGTTKNLSMMLLDNN